MKTPTVLEENESMYIHPDINLERRETQEKMCTRCARLTH